MFRVQGLGAEGVGVLGKTVGFGLSFGIGAQGYRV